MKPTAEGERVAWLVYSRGGQYRRTKHCNERPALRADEHAFRVVLPAPMPDRRTHTVRAEEAP